MSDYQLLITRLKEQMARGNAVLFTGTGFSTGATDREGSAIPMTKELLREIWALTWPDDPVDPQASLRDTYQAALNEGRNKLAELLRRRLTIDPDSVTDNHRLWLSMPWRRAYTINIDDLESAAQRRFGLPRSIRSFSALEGRLPLDRSDGLLYIHLNGTLDDIPDCTFTDPQYGLRHSSTDPLYEQLAADLLAYPVVFVGTQLQESLLWEYIALRDDRGSRGVREHRPASYLVSSELSRDRERMLSLYNIHWIPGTADEFATNVLSQLGEAPERGHQTILAEIGAARSGKIVLPSVSELLAVPFPKSTDYLLGAQPTWGDVRSGRAVEREFEESIDLLRPAGVLVITGTAGAGCSTTLMRLGVRLSGTGRDVRFVSADHSFTAHDLSRYLSSNQEPLVVIIDDADTFGRGLRDLVNDISDDDQVKALLIVGIRATRIDQLLPDWRADGGRRQEISVPLLENSDIELLIEALDSDNKLGALKPLDHDGRVARIEDECGRELLVAMIEATSGEKLEVRAVREYDDLQSESRLIYGIVAIASEQRFPLFRDEVLMASGDLSNTALHALDTLKSRRLLVMERGGYALRHRRIAELVVNGMRNSAEMMAPYRGLLRGMAARY